MARSFGSWLRVGPRGASFERARAAEARGDWPEAAARYVDAGRPEEAARVLLSRADGEARLSLRLRYYAQAVSTAPEGSPVRDEARLRRAAAVVQASAASPLTDGLRRQLAAAARELESLGAYAAAADAHARLDDGPARAKALERAGAIGALAEHLDADQAQERRTRAVRRAHDEMSHWIAVGARRAALAVARANAGDPSLDERARALRNRRSLAGGARALFAGRRVRLVVGTRVVVGRTTGPGAPPRGEAQLLVASPAVSRQHLALEHDGANLLVRDLGSRHGTRVGPAPGGPPLGSRVVGSDGLEVWLGGEVRMSIRPRPSGAVVRVAAMDETWLVGVGSLPLGVGRWRLERSEEEWLELVTDDEPPAFAGGLQLVDRVALLAGDAVAVARDGPPCLEMLG